MIQVTEKESFWTIDDWERTKKLYFDPLIENGVITNFKCAVVDDVRGREGLYTVERSYTDMRYRRPLDLGPKQLPPQINADYTIELTMADAADGLEIIQDYKDYWPGMEMLLYGLAQAKDSDVSVYIQLSNYEHDDDEDFEGTIKEM